jgi:hypothetical protein
MAAMGVMEVSIDQVVHVIAMRNRFVATSGPMHVGSIMTPAAVLRRAPVRIGRWDFDDMFVDVVAVHVMQLPVMQVVDVTVVADGGMPAIGAMNVWMVAKLRSH